MWKQDVLTGSEKESLHISLERHHDAMLGKIEGLDDEQLRRPMTSTGTDLLGQVRPQVRRCWCHGSGPPSSRPERKDSFDDTDSAHLPHAGSPRCARRG